MKARIIQFVAFTVGIGLVACIIYIITKGAKTGFPPVFLSPNAYPQTDSAGNIIMTPPNIPVNPRPNSQAIETAAQSGQVVPINRANKMLPGGGRRIVN